MSSSNNLKKNFMKKCFKKNKIVKRGNKRDMRQFKIGRRKDRGRSSFVDKTTSRKRTQRRRSKRMLGKAIHGNEWWTIAT